MLPWMYVDAADGAIAGLQCKICGNALSDGLVESDAGPACSGAAGSANSSDTENSIPLLRCPSDETPCILHARCLLNHFMECKAKKPACHICKYNYKKCILEMLLFASERIPGEKKYTVCKWLMNWMAKHDYAPDTFSFSTNEIAHIEYGLFQSQFRTAPYGEKQARATSSMHIKYILDGSLKAYSQESKHKQYISDIYLNTIIDSAFLSEIGFADNILLLEEISSISGSNSISKNHYVNNYVKSVIMCPSIDFGDCTGQDVKKIMLDVKKLILPSNPNNDWGWGS